MANDGTALGALQEIIGNAGGTSDAQTLVPAIEDLGEIIGSGGGGGGGTIADGSITTAKLADRAVNNDKLAYESVTTAQLDLQELENDGGVARMVTFDQTLRGGIPFKLIATDATSQAIAVRLGGSEDVPIMQPKDLYDPSTGARLFMKDAMMLVWLNGTVVEGARLQFYGVLNGTNVIPHVYAKGNGSMASGVLGVDESWTITANA